MAETPEILDRESSKQWLVRLPTDIIVTWREEEGPVVERIPPKVAEWLGKSTHDLEGQPLSRVFGETLPDIAFIAEEVYRSCIPVRNYLAYFKDHSGYRHSILIQADLKDQIGKNRSKAVVLHLEDVSDKEEFKKGLVVPKKFHGMVGQAPAILNVFRKIETYGPTDAPVLITGETGTGKELVARALHQSSPRRRNPFVAVNCCALSSELLESELFGHEKGSFTGAIRSHKGRFERADRGTLFLDEVGDMPLSAQAKLLRVLEEKAVERVGGEEEKPIDVRIITATNVSLEEAVFHKRFRADLYHRISVLRINLPPLRQRTGDIPLLVNYFLSLFNQKYRRNVVRLTREALALLESYSWPGNIRELRNVLERAYVETQTNVIGRQAFEEWLRERSLLVPSAWDMHPRQTMNARTRPLITPYAGPPPQLAYDPYQMGEPPLGADLWIPPISLERETEGLTGPAKNGNDLSDHKIYDIDISHIRSTQRRKELTESMIRDAYTRAKGNITRAAKLLGIHRATLYRHMKSLGLKREDLDHSSAGIN